MPNATSTTKHVYDTLDQISDALLLYVQNSAMLGVIPRVSTNIVRSPSDLPGTTADNEWSITLNVSAIEKFEEDGTIQYSYRQDFKSDAATKSDAILHLAHEVRSYLVGESHIRKTQLDAAQGALTLLDALAQLEPGQVVGHETSLESLWTPSDPQPKEEGENMGELFVESKQQVGEE